MSNAGESPLQSHDFFLFHSETHRSRAPVHLFPRYTQCKRQKATVGSVLHEALLTTKAGYACLLRWFRAQHWRRLRWDSTRTTDRWILGCWMLAGSVVLWLTAAFPSHLLKGLLRVFRHVINSNVSVFNNAHCYLYQYRRLHTAVLLSPRPPAPPHTHVRLQPFLPGEWSRAPFINARPRPSASSLAMRAPIGSHQSLQCIWS